MRKSYRLLAALLFASIYSLTSLAQNTTISGNVRNGVNKDVVPAVSVTIKGSSSGTFTDEKGNFKLNTTQQPPFTLIFTSVGFEPQEIVVNNSRDIVQVDFVPSSTLGVEVVVSASRVPERILESPVSIERVNLSSIRNTPATSYYDIFRNTKGVDLTTSSLTFNTVSTRGFNGSGSARVNQLIDGMDNQAPGLNFSVGNVVGLTELDVESMELLPGASSVLYGPGGMNGTVLLNSKNPFKYQGLSYQVKMGINHTDKRQLSKPAPFYDWTVRWAQKISDKAAFKIGVQFVHAKDWIATDTSNYLIGDASVNDYGKVVPGTRLTDPNYDGVNVYGDETFTNIKPIVGLVAAGLRPQLPAQLQPLLDQQVGIINATPGAINVSRTGYQEKEVVNNNTINVKLSGAFHYKLTPNLEASLTAYWGTGNTVYTGSDRYSFKALKIGQYKFELKHKNWFVRAYTTQENSGEAYNATITTRIFNEKWKASPTWYQQYVVAFLQAKLGLLPGSGPAGNPSDNFNAHLLARGVADVGRPVSGTSGFTQLYDQVRSIPIKKGGGLLVDASDLYHAEGQYNFGHLTGKLFDLIAGASVKRYTLNSEGTIFADSAGRIKIDEIGAYAQISKSLFKERVKFSAAGRFDKNTNFEGRFTPRFTTVIKLVQNHNLRGSYQTAYRFPTTQNQWINLQVGGGSILLGGLPGLREFYKFRSVRTLNDNPSGLPAYTLESVRAGGALLQAGNVPGAIGALKEAQFGTYKPETLRAFEVGYKGLFHKRILVDLYAYWGKYENFLGRQIVVQSLNSANPVAPFLGPSRIISVAVNSASKVSSYGYGGSIDWMLPRNFIATTNLTFDRLRDLAPGFISFFNVPTFRLNMGLSNTGFGHQKLFGFSVMMRTQDGFFYESDFRQGRVEDYTLFDAQLSYKLPAKRSIVKLGGTNILNRYYKTAFGNPEVGAIYYISFAYNVF
ncbi:MAG: TonB-dependent receptor domain-containing protein [Chitinophagaceae bacterium]